MIVTNEQIGQRLGRLRDRAGMTQAELADMMHISQSKLSRIESGEKTANPDELQRAVQVLPLPSVQQLFAEDFSVTDHTTTDATRKQSALTVQNLKEQYAYLTEHTINRGELVVLLCLYDRQSGPEDSARKNEVIDRATNVYTEAYSAELLLRLTSKGLIASDPPKLSLHKDGYRVMEQITDTLKDRARKTK